MQRVCFFNSTKAWGGGEKWHFDMSRILCEQGYPVVFVTGKRSELVQRLQHSKVPFHLIRIGKFSYLNLFLIYRLKCLFQKERIDCIIMNLSVDLKVAGIAAKWAGVKRIIYRRGSAIPIKNRLYNRLLFKHIITDVIANSEATRNTILQHNPNLFDDAKIRVIYNGIEFESDHSIPSNLFYTRRGNEIVLGNAGRMVFQKGQEYLVELAAKLKSEGIHFKLLIAGSGPLESALKEQIEKSGVGDCVLLVGFADSINAFMRNIDIFLLSSRWEGFGFVLAEAMAAKKPIVAFNISSNPELVVSGENGFLAEPFDMDELFKHTISLIKSEELRNRFGERGYEMVHQKFDINRTVEELKDMLKI